MTCTELRVYSLKFHFLYIVILGTKSNPCGDVLYIFICIIACVLLWIHVPIRTNHHLWQTREDIFSRNPQYGTYIQNSSINQTLRHIIRFLSIPTINSSSIRNFTYYFFQRKKFQKFPKLVCSHHVLGYFKNLNKFRNACHHFRIDFELSRTT